MAREGKRGRRTALPPPEVAAETAEEVDDLDNLLPRPPRLAVVELSIGAGLALLEREALLELPREALRQPPADALPSMAVIDAYGEHLSGMRRFALPPPCAAGPDVALPRRE